MDLDILGRLITRIPLVHIGNFDCVAGHMLDLRGQLRYLRPILCVGGGDLQRQQVPQGIDCQMDFTAAFAFGPVIPGTGTAFRRRLERAAIENGRRGLRGTALGQPQHLTEIMDNGRKHTRCLFRKSCASALSG